MMEATIVCPKRKSGIKEARRAATTALAAELTRRYR
jgi:hypothetical protein